MRSPEHESSEDTAEIEVTADCVFPDPPKESSQYPKSFFKIEEVRSNLNVGMFKGSSDDLIVLRENNWTHGRPLNSGLPYYPEEKELIGKMYLEGRSMGEIIDYFQRAESSVRKITSTFLAEDLKHVKKDSEANLFLEEILNGVDPITGNALGSDSAWKHPKIISDIKDFLEVRASNDSVDREKTKNQSAWGLVDIKDWIKGNHDGVDAVIIQQGYYFSVFDEDAVLFSEEFGFKVFRAHENSVPQSGFPVYVLEKYMTMLRERNFKYVVVEQAGGKHPNGRMIRKIIYPEVLKGEGKVF